MWKELRMEGIKLKRERRRTYYFRACWKLFLFSDFCYGPSTFLTGSMNYCRSGLQLSNLSTGPYHHVLHSTLSNILFPVHLLSVRLK